MPRVNHAVRYDNVFSACAMRRVQPAVTPFVLLDKNEAAITPEY